MEAQPFSIGEAIKEGWKLTKEHLGFLIVYQLIMYLVFILFSGSRYTLKGELINILGTVIMVLIKMGFYRSALLITNGIEPGFDQLYKNWRLFLSWIVASLLFSLMVAVGLILLIVPGLYLMARFGFFPFFILDRDLGPINALKKTAHATKGLCLKIFLLFLACTGLNLLGLLLFVVGLLFTVPTTVLALATVYRKITQQNSIVVT